MFFGLEVMGQASSLVILSSLLLLYQEMVLIRDEMLTSSPKATYTQLNFFPIWLAFLIPSLSQDSP